MDRTAHRLLRRARTHRPDFTLTAEAAALQHAADALIAQTAERARQAVRTVCLDFDGTLTMDEPYMPGIAQAAPRPGVQRAVRRLHEAGYRLVVLTARPPAETIAWLHDQGLLPLIAEVTNTKPPAVAYIDDRAVAFDGSWARILERVEALERSHTRPVAGNDNLDASAQPSAAQRKAGNYKKDKVSVFGLPISIENRAGTERVATEVDEAGEPLWRTTMRYDYGYIRGTESADGDAVDVFLHPETGRAEHAVIINQLTPDGAFDEHKIMLGWLNPEDAVKAYLEHYPAGHERNIGSVRSVPVSFLKLWLAHGNTRLAASADVDDDLYASFFKECERDDKGWCLPGDGDQDIGGTHATLKVFGARTAQASVVLEKGGHRLHVPQTVVRGMLTKDEGAFLSGGKIWRWKDDPVGGVRVRSDDGVEIEVTGAQLTRMRLALPGENQRKPDNTFDPRNGPLGRTPGYFKLRHSTPEAKVSSRADLERLAKGPHMFADDDQYEYLTHAVRSDASIDSILKDGLQPKTDTVFLSKGLVRDMGAGYVIVRVPKGEAKTGTDHVEKGLTYKERTLNRAVAPEDVVGVVRQVHFPDGFSLREDELAQIILNDPDHPDHKDLPEPYQSWVTAAKGATFDPATERTVSAAVEWDEELHPRNADGTFASVGQVKAWSRKAVAVASANNAKIRAKRQGKPFGPKQFAWHVDLIMTSDIHYKHARAGLLDRAKARTAKPKEDPPAKRLLRQYEDMGPESLEKADLQTLRNEWHTLRPAPGAKYRGVAAPPSLQRTLAHPGRRVRITGVTSAAVSEKVARDYATLRRGPQAGDEPLVDPPAHYKPIVLTIEDSPLARDMNGIIRKGEVAYPPGTTFEVVKAVRYDAKGVGYATVRALPPKGLKASADLELSAAWDEDEHPRDDAGRFTESESTSGTEAVDYTLERDEAEAYLDDAGVSPQAFYDALDAYVDHNITGRNDAVLNRGLAALPGYDGMTYRGFAMPGARVAALREGEVITSFGASKPASASTKLDIAKGFALPPTGAGAADRVPVVLAIAPSSRGVAIETLTEHGGEHEVLFPAGTGFRVTAEPQPLMFGDGTVAGWRIPVEPVWEKGDAAPPVSDAPDEDGDADEDGWNDDAPTTPGSVRDRPARGHLWDEAEGVKELERLGVSPKDAKAMMEVVSEYTSAGFETINDCLRKPTDCDPQTAVTRRTYSTDVTVDDEVKQLDRFLRVAPRFNGGPVFRAVTLTADEAKQLVVGATFEDPAYASGTSEYRTAMGYADASTHAPNETKVMLSIKAPKSGVSVTQFSSHPEEREVLFPRNTKFRVTRVQQHPRMLMLEVEEV